MLCVGSLEMDTLWHFLGFRVKLPKSSAGGAFSLFEVSTTISFGTVLNFWNIQFIITFDASF